MAAEATADFLPGGWEGASSESYSGALAIIADSLVFDCPGPGSNPSMKKLDGFAIPLKDIAAAEVSQTEGVFGKRVVRIFTGERRYFFLSAQADAFAEKLKPLTNAR